MTRPSLFRVFRIARGGSPASAAEVAALARGLRVGPHREQDEAGRVNRILELMDQHWRAATPWERAELDAEIRRLSRMG